LCKGSIQVQNIVPHRALKAQAFELQDLFLDHCFDFLRNRIPENFTAWFSRNLRKSPDSLTKTRQPFLMNSAKGFFFDLAQPTDLCDDIIPIPTSAQRTMPPTGSRPDLDARVTLNLTTPLRAMDEPIDLAQTLDHSGVTLVSNFQRPPTGGAMFQFANMYFGHFWV
jgi:hypothetical protein